MTGASILTTRQILELRRWASFSDTPKARDWAARSKKAIQIARDILFDDLFASGTDLAQPDLRQLFKEMRAIIWNQSLGQLIRNDQQIRQLNPILRDFLHGKEPLLDRMERFIRLPNVGPVTMSHFMFILDPTLFPLIAPQTLLVLNTTDEQKVRAERQAIEIFDIENPAAIDTRVLNYLRDSVIFAEAKAVLGVETYDALNRILWLAQETEVEDIVFVNIGWTKFYDGTELVEGGHAWIAEHARDPKQISEGRAFQADIDGTVTCGIGYGRIREESQKDIVFVARHPSKGLYEAVGIYFNPSISYRNVGDPPREFAFGTTNSYYRIPFSQRPSINWPSGRDMRRWAKRGGIVRWPELIPPYKAIVDMSLVDEENEQDLSHTQYALNPVTRRAIDDRAIEVTQEHFEAKGAKVMVMPHNNPGYDLEITSTRYEQYLKIEVKGTTTKGSAVTVTRTEFKFLQSGETILAVVSEIELTENGGADGGELTLYDKVPEGLANGAFHADPVQYRLVLA